MRRTRVRRIIVQGEEIYAQKDCGYFFVARALMLPDRVNIAHALTLKGALKRLFSA